MKQIPNDSLLAVLTCAELPPRNYPLSPHVAVIVLSRCVRSLNLTKIESLEELGLRRETAALLIGLRGDIQRQAARQDADA